MKKLMLVLLALSMGAAIAVNLQEVFQGTWSNVGVYRTHKVYGSGNYTAPVVKDASGTFIMTNTESTAPVGIAPESSAVTAYWTQI